MGDAVSEARMHNEPWQEGSAYFGRIAAFLARLPGERRRLYDRAL